MTKPKTYYMVVDENNIPIYGLMNDQDADCGCHSWAATALAIFQKKNEANAWKNIREKLSKYKSLQSNDYQ